MKKLDIYIASVAFLVAGIYVGAASVCLGGLVVWALSVAETTLNQKNRDAEIVRLLERMEKIEKEHKSLSMDITNVAERAKTVLGEVY